jgi:iron complex transport system substrate-binding protein
MSRMFIRRGAAAAAALALAATLAACGSQAEAEPTTEDAAAAQERTLQTAMGEVTVPAEPQRVVVLDTDSLDSAVTLGVTPVGAAVGDVGAPFSTYLPEEDLEGLTEVGVVWEPNVEAVAALEPDVILGSKVRHEAVYEQLSAIAPTVFTETTGPEWRENFELHAQALGKEEEAEQVAADFDARVDEVVEAIGGQETVAETTVGFTRFIEGAPTRLYLDDTFVGSLFKELGVGRPANLEPTGFSLDVSPEQIDQANADVIFYSTYGDPQAAKETEITEGPLWQELDAVKAGKVYRVDDNLWMLGIGYSGAELVLDQIEESLGS